MMTVFSRKEIDEQKYRHLLLNSPQSNFYAQIENLDFLCEDWELLVFNDYEAVMPIPIKKKLGKRFVISPIFCQQLGVFGEKDSIEVNELFLQYLHTNYSVVFYPFNFQNHFETNLPQMKNFVVKKNEMEGCSKKYSKGRKYDVAQARKKLKVEEVTWDEISRNFAYEHFRGLDKKKDLDSLFHYLDYLAEKGALKIVAAKLDGQIINLSIAATAEDSEILLALVNHKDFMKNNGASLVIDYLLQNLDPSKKLDFMGGNVRGIEIFFKSFGAENESFQVVENSKKDLVKNWIGW